MFQRAGVCQRAVAERGHRAQVQRADDGLGAQVRVPMLGAGRRRLTRSMLSSSSRPQRCQAGYRSETIAEVSHRCSRVKLPASVVAASDANVLREGLALVERARRPPSNVGVRGEACV